MKKQAQYNPQTRVSTFSHNVHHGELIPGTKVNNDAPGAFGQKLASANGLAGAAKSLLSRRKK